MNIKLTNVSVVIIGSVRCSKAVFDGPKLFLVFGWPKKLCGISGDKQLPCILTADAQNLQVIAAERLLDVVAWHAHLRRC